MGVSVSVAAPQRDSTPSASRCYAASWHAHARTHCQHARGMWRQQAYRLAGTGSRHRTPRRDPTRRRRTAVPSSRSSRHRAPPAPSPREARPAHVLWQRCAEPPSRRVNSGDAVTGGLAGRSGQVATRMPQAPANACGTAHARRCGVALVSRERTRPPGFAPGAHSWLRCRGSSARRVRNRRVPTRDAICNFNLRKFSVSAKRPATRAIEASPSPRADDPGREPFSHGWNIASAQQDAERIADHAALHRTTAGFGARCARVSSWLGPGVLELGPGVLERHHGLVQAC